MYISFDLIFFLGTYCWPVSKKDCVRCSRGLTHCGSSCICVFFKLNEWLSGGAWFLLQRAWISCSCSWGIWLLPSVRQLSWRHLHWSSTLTAPSSHCGKKVIFREQYIWCWYLSLLQTRNILLTKFLFLSYIFFRGQHTSSWLLSLLQIRCTLKFLFLFCFFPRHLGYTTNSKWDEFLLYMFTQLKIIVVDVTFHVLVPDITCLFHAYYSHKKNYLYFLEYVWFAFGNLVLIPSAVVPCDALWVSPPYTEGHNMVSLAFIFDVFLPLGAGVGTQ